MLPAQLGRAPRHLLVCERGHARHPRSRHEAHVRDHAYSCRVSFLIPECGMLPEVLKSTIADIGEYYLVRNLPVHELVAHEFIDAFVKKGSCYALTYKTKIDQDNTAALLPSGKLILSVDKDTYEELGLQGRPSQYSGKKVMRYIVTIDLTDAGFHPESKKHNRVLWALKEKKPLEFDFLLAWYNTGLPCIELCCYFGEPKLAYWLTLTVHGFADSPVSWRESEHGFHKGGENLYNFVIFRNLDYWLQMAVGAHDDCPP
ncbi:hypothetical protein TURU_136118 [Turdus rufiventris]|nr:hypothetical protein TURU_136118 [Turdus rufiventris]